MKKINTLLLILTLLMLNSVSAYAWDINSQELGMSFKISDTWSQTSYSTEFPAFVNNNNSGEKINFEIYYSESYQLNVPESKRYCTERYSIQKLSTDLSKTNNTLVSVAPIASWDKTITYNGVEYYNYVQTYSAKATGYNTSYGMKSAYITIQNGKGYLIEYSLFTDKESKLESIYNNAEIFNLLRSMSYKPGEIGIYINNEKVEPDSAPILIESRTMVPIRVIAEKLNYEVAWNADIQTVTLTPATSADPTLVLKIGEATMLENYSEQIPLDVAPMIINNRTYLPARAVAESMNAIVDWDPVARAVVIWKQ